jgi:cellulose synthase/poly-beta-1,6-N-acetylglucosamine synthase-like glycosyltransferase
MSWVAVGILAAQVSLLACFAFFAFFNYLYGLAALKTPRLRRVAHSGRPVAVVIVSYNEEFVISGTIRACESLTYPNKLVVLSDDSDDPSIVATQTSLAQQRGCQQGRMPAFAHAGSTASRQTRTDVWESPAFVYLHRSSNDGFKGGNLRQVSAYLRSRGIELMYLLDADWHPQEDAIEQALEVLEGDARLAFVQTKRLTQERGMSLLQRYVSLSEEGCYYVDFEGRQALGHPILFSGCCTLLRLDAVEEVGGFAHGHLTEDLDVTNRLWLGGWRGAYCGTVVNRGEVPFTYDDFRRQQERWAYGTARCLKDYAVPLLRSRHLTWGEKLSAFRQNAYFSTSLLTTAAIGQGMAVVVWLHVLSGSYAVEYYLALVGRWRAPLLLAVYVCLLSNVIEPLVMILVKKRQPGELLHLPMGVWFAWSVIPAYVVGNVKALAGVRTTFFRTPKFLRGRIGVLSRVGWSTRAAHGTICLALLAFYAFEGWAFGWRDPFALLLVPAFVLATLAR